MARSSTFQTKPPASSDAVRRRLQRQARRDTAPEVRLRRALFALGLRYRTHFRVLPTSRRTADIAFTRARVAVDVRGCFWHGCPEHGHFPRSNSDWWRAKLERNRARDVGTEMELRALGWRVLVVWEHEPVWEAAVRVQAIVLGHDLDGR